MLAKRFVNITLIAVLCGIGATSCGKKEEPTSETPAPEPEKVATTVAETPVAPAPAKASLEDRAAKLGFARNLPKNTQGFLGVYDGAGLVAELRASKLGRYLEKMASAEGMDLDDVNEDPEAGMVLSLLKEELFVAVGEGTPKQCTNLLELQALNSFGQMKMLVGLAAAAVGGEEPVESVGLGAMGSIAFLQDSDGLARIVEGSQMPPVLIGFKVSDEEARNSLGQMIAGGLAEGVGFLGPDGEDVAEAVTIPALGSELTGIRFLGEKVIAKVREEGAEESMNEALGAANTGRILTSLSKKNALAAAGVIGNYVVIFAGSDASELQFAESLDESLVAHSDLAFVDGYLDKRLVAVSTLSKPLMESLGESPNTFGNMTAGIKAGLQGTEAFGDTRDLEVLLDLVGKQEAALRGMFRYLPAGVVVYRDQGYKLDAFGGSTRPDADLAATHKYGPLADWEGALLYASGVSNKEYVDKALEWLDTIGETVYLAAKKVSLLETEDNGDLADFKKGFGMFDEMFRDDALRLWKALREDLTEGLGDECAILVDLKGEMPVLPLPEAVLKEGRAPRVAVVAPIENREKLRSSWQTINSSLESILKKVGEMNGGNIPMLKPMSTETDDLITWFFQIPIQSDDFLLSVSLDEDTFYATSSKKFVQEISAKVDAGGDAVTGEHLRVDLATLRGYLADVLTLVDNNAEDIFQGGGRADSFREDLPQLREILDAFSEVHEFSIDTRLEDGVPHTSVRLHVE